MAHKLNANKSTLAVYKVNCKMVCCIPLARDSFMFNDYNIYWFLKLLLAQYFH